MIRKEERVKFVKQNSAEAFYMHQPHPGNELKPYQVDDLITFLSEGGYLK
ncbi:MAG: hypothetical protein IKX83_01015 [Clostridia bacterium]|nr:hypothetical protein [Clostridia bacterium]